MARLCEAGLLKKHGDPIKQVQAYRILHPRLLSSIAEEPEEKPTVIRSSIVCPKCHQKRPALLRCGICRSCNWDLKVRRIAREEIAGAAVEKTA